MKRQYKVICFFNMTMKKSWDGILQFKVEQYLGMTQDG